MVFFQRWTPRVAGVVGCALLGVLCVPTPANADAGATQSSAPAWAVVSADGTLVRGNGATSVAHLADGVYSVLFTRRMRNCAYEAIGGATSTSPVGAPVATEATPGVNPKSVVVKTFDQAVSAAIDQPFHLVAYCGAKANFAVVEADGTLAHGSHTTGISHTSAGAYAITFDHDVSVCAFTATGRAANAVGEITVAGLLNTPAGVFVQTLSRAGAKVDTPFSLAVDCGAANAIAVIKRGGNTARGAHVTSSVELQTGAYEVIFDRDVTACAYTATVGLAANGGEIDDPVTITASSRVRNVNGVAVALIDVSGAPRDEPFHLKVTC